MRDAAGSPLNPSRNTISPTAADAALPAGNAIRIDVDGIITDAGNLPEARKGMRYASLFEDADRLRGLPEQLLRLAARHGTVRDEVLRSRADGRPQCIRLELRAVRDDAHGDLRGFEERQLTSGRTGTAAFLDGLDLPCRDAIRRARQELAGGGRPVRMGVLRTSDAVERTTLLLLQERCRGKGQRLLPAGRDSLVLVSTAVDEASLREQLQDVARALRNASKAPMRIVDVALLPPLQTARAAAAPSA